MRYGFSASAVLAAAFSLVAETPDRFVGYVESTGSQIVDVGVVGKYGTAAEIKLQMMSLTSPSVDIGILDAKGAGDTRVYFAHATNGQFCYGYGVFNYQSYNSNRLYWELNRVYTVHTDYSVTQDDKVLATMTVDGCQVLNRTYNDKIDSGQNLYLFGSNISGAISYRAKMRCYGLKIWQDDANGDRQLVRDFKPCVKDGVAGLYDEVSDTIFYSANSTPLIYDVNEDVPDEYIEYVESDGYTYVDTGIIGRSGMRCDADMMWLKLGGDYGFLNARSNSATDTRIFFIHSNSSKMAMGYGAYIGNYDGHSYAENTRYSIQSTLRAGEQRLVVNGVTEYSASSTATYDSGVTLTLFGNHIGDTMANRCLARCYGLKIWQDDANGVEQLVRDFKPCLKNGVAGLYDAVSQRIFYPTVRPLLFDNRKDGMPDSFVEYIEANGFTSLDTGVRARTGTRAAGDFMWTELRSNAAEKYAYLGEYPSGSPSRTERSYLSALKDSNTRFYMVHEWDAHMWIGYGSMSGYPSADASGVLTSAINSFKFVKDQRYSFDASFMNGAQTLDIDGTRYCSTNSVEDVDAGCNLTLFANNYLNVKRYTAFARCYGLKIWQDGALVRDFKPCVKDGRGMLYDVVSKKMFRPTPDITSEYVGQVVADEAERPAKYVEYVETDGSMYVDTEVPGKSGTAAEFKMQWLSGGSGDQSFLGARGSNINSRLFFWHHNTSAPPMMCYGYNTFCYVMSNATEVGSFAGTNHRYLEKDFTYHVTSSLNPGAQQITANGELVKDGGDPASVDTGCSLYLFAANVDGTPDYISKARLYFLRIWQNGALVRNFKPVRLTSGRVALWDKVSDRIFTPVDRNGALKQFSGIGPDGADIRKYGIVFSIR